MAAAGVHRCSWSTAAMASLSDVALVVMLLVLCVGGSMTTAAEHHHATCEEVRMKCAFGASCSLALHNYFSKCNMFFQAGRSDTCPESCLYALVALTSTEDGKRLLDCTCRDRQCEDMKNRVEVCRPLVIEAAKNETVVPCELAQWICMVDQVCSTALGYYQTYCKRTLQGAACTERCLNSAEILQRQEKAIKMNRCKCSGKTTVECLRNKERMVRMCYGGGGVGVGGDGSPQSGGGGGGGNKSGNVGRKYRKKHRTRMFDMDPDRAVVEMMMANPDYLPDGWRGYNATAGGDSKGSARAVRAPSAGVLCALVAASFFLVKRPSVSG